MVILWAYEVNDTIFTARNAWEQLEQKITELQIAGHIIDHVIPLEYQKAIPFSNYEETILEQQNKVYKVKNPPSLVDVLTRVMFIVREG